MHNYNLSYAVLKGFECEARDLLGEDESEWFYICKRGFAGKLTVFLSPNLSHMDPAAIMKNEFVNL